MSIFIAILIFCVVIVVHELGHYFCAVANGIGVDEFAVGMGPKIVSKKMGDTVWSLRLFPIGGFCKMTGEDTTEFDENSTENIDIVEVVTPNPRSINNKPVWRRMIAISGGVVMNFILSVVVCVIIAMFQGFGVAEVAQVIPDTPAYNAGLQVGDKITALNGKKIHTYNDFTFFMSDADGSPVTATVKRGTQTLNLVITPYQTTDTGQVRYIFGIYRGWHDAVFGRVSGENKRATFAEALYEGLYTPIYYVKTTFVGLTRLVMANVSVKELSGPIGIVSAISDAYNSAGAVDTGNYGMSPILLTVLNFMAFLSANLAVVNLLPLPALDGGRLVFYVIEVFRGKPIDPNKEGLVHFAGFVLIMLFAVFVAVNDIIKLI